MAMKKIMMILACVVAMTTVACEKYEDGRPSKDVRTEFKKMYPEAKDVEWGHEPGFWVVSFACLSKNEATYLPKFMNYASQITVD